MYNCTICGQEFLNYDEYIQHMMGHYYEKADQAMKLMNDFMSMQSNLDQIIEPMAQRVAEIISSRMPVPVAVASPPKPKFSFEAMQLATLAISSGKNIDEIINICAEAQSKIWESKEGG